MWRRKGRQPMVWIDPDSMPWLSDQERVELRRWQQDRSRKFGWPYRAVWLKGVPGGPTEVPPGADGVPADDVVVLEDGSVVVVPAPVRQAGSG